MIRAYRPNATAHNVTSLVADWGELDKFLKWLPELSEGEAYLVQLMIRSRELKEKFGFKGSDHVLAFKAVHGYLSAPLPDGTRLWRLRLREAINQLAVLAVQGGWYYIRYSPGTSDTITEVVKIPWPLTAVYIHINPSDIVKAAASTTKEIVDSLAVMARSSEVRIKELFRRPDTRYYANLARFTRKRFHVVDADTQDLFNLAVKLFEETFGYTPPRIITSRGGHILINLETLGEEGLINRYVGRPDKEITKLIARYKNAENTKEKEEIVEKVVNYAYRPDEPFYHRITALSAVLLDEKGSPMIELKKQALEPVPGTIYKGRYVIRFIP